MIFTPLTQKAMVLSHEYYKDKTDLAGLPMIYRQMYIAMNMTDETGVLIALLEGLRDEQIKPFPEFVVQTVILLRQRTETSLVETAANIKASLNHYASMVLKQGLIYDYDLSRFEEIDPPLFNAYKAAQVATALLDFRILVD
jgi:hypothetical protein